MKRILPLYQTQNWLLSHHCYIRQSQFLHRGKSFPFSKRKQCLKKIMLHHYKSHSGLRQPTDIKHWASVSASLSSYASLWHSGHPTSNQCNIHINDPVWEPSLLARRNVSCLDFIPGSAPTKRASQKLYKKLILFPRILVQTN